MRNRMEITAPRARRIKIHIIKEGAGKPYCGSSMTANTKVISYDELMKMDKDGRVCGICLRKELGGGF